MPSADARNCPLHYHPDDRRNAPAFFASENTAMTTVSLQPAHAALSFSMNALRAALLPALAMMLAACSTATPAAEGRAATFIVVRHAEKGSDDARDPSLSSIGLARAERLAARLAQEPLAAVYATAYRRTRQTAKPAADAHGIAVTIYDAQLPAEAFASQLRVAHRQGTVLIVGHSNTVPDIVAALSGADVEAMTEQQFDRFYRVRIGVDGKATLSQDHY